MTLNLNELFSKQKELDAHIVKEKGLQGQDLFNKKIVALLAELYECVNEARFFKFWSDDQKPNNKIKKRKDCDECEGVGFHIEKNGISSYTCSNCKGKGSHVVGYKNSLLEEYADIIHFALSIANDIGYTEHKYIKTQTRDLNELVICITNNATILSISKQHRHMNVLMNSILQFRYQLGFEEKQIIEAYHDKNKINYERQANDY